MPSSRPNTIPTVIHLLRQLAPQSILDVGVGFGKWGHLFREYTDIQESEHDPARYDRKNWRVKIDGIEGFPAYLTEMHRYLYNQLFTGDALEVLKTLGTYNLIFLGDIIEHLDKPAGIELVREAVAHANKAVVLSTPRFATDQTDLCGNPMERHRSLWSEKDFRKFEGAIVKTIDRATLLAVLVKPGLATLSLTPPKAPNVTAIRRLRRAMDDIRGVIPADATFILVDEEQIRSELPPGKAIPFLEKDGQYWGPRRTMEPPLPNSNGCDRPAHRSSFSFGPAFGGSNIMPHFTNTCANASNGPSPIGGF